MAQSELHKTLAVLRKTTKIGKLTDDQFEETLRPRPRTTGNLAINSVIGIGGLPKGRVIEMYGPPSSGKTTTALQTMAACQQAGGRVMFIDHERSLDEKYIRALGIDPDDETDGIPSFIYVQPRSFEAGSNTFRPLMEWIDVVTTDSVAAMVTEGELAALTGKVEFAARAKMMHQYMRQVTGPIADTGTTMIFLNHQQDVIDTSPMGQKMAARGIKRTSTPGGSALKFYASVRIAFKQIGNVRTKEYDAITNEKVDIATATKTQITIVKNKVADPFGQCEARVRFGKGFSNEWSALDILEKHGRIKKDGAIYRFLNTELSPQIALGKGDNGEDLIVYAGGLAKQNWGHKDKTTQTPAHWWVRGEENVMELLEKDPAFGAAAIAEATELVKGGWSQKASAEEIESFKEEDSGSEAALKAELAEAQTIEDLKEAGGSTTMSATEMSDLFGPAAGPWEVTK